MKFKKDEDGKLVLDDNGDPIAVGESGEVIPLDKVVSLIKHERIATEREEYKTKVGELEGQIATLKESVGNAEELKAKVEELTTATETAKTEFEARLATEIGTREREYALDTTLLGAGVPQGRLKAAKALIDAESVKLEDGKLQGFDIDAFKKDNDYLFTATQSVDVGAQPRGGSPDSRESAMRAVMGLKEE